MLMTEIDVIYTSFLKNFTSNSVLGLRNVNYNKQSTAIYLSTCIYAAIPFGTNSGNNPKSFIPLPVCCSITTCLETASFHQQIANNQTYCLKPRCLLHDLVFVFFSVSCHDEEYCRKGQDLWLSECQVRGFARPGSVSDLFTSQT